MTDVESVRDTGSESTNLVVGALRISGAGRKGARNTDTRRTGGTVGAWSGIAAFGESNRKAYAARANLSRRTISVGLAGWEDLRDTESD